ncbi:MAG: RNA-guided endonuclease TnpB family protein [Candidatus Hermodarchaeota archaeon]
MIKDKQKDENYCKNCGAPLPSIEINARKTNKPIICECCGFMLFTDDLTNNCNDSEEFIPHQARIFIFRRIYELLDCNECKEKVINGKKTLKDSELANFTDFLLKSLLKLKISDDLRDRIILSKDRLQEWIQFVYGLMARMDKNFNFKFKYRQDIIEDLKTHYGFPFKHQNLDENTRDLILYFSRVIYDITKTSNFISKSSRRNSNLIDAIFSEIVNKDIKIEWVNKFGSKISKSVKKRYYQLLFDLKCNQIYQESFIDFLKSILDLILTLKEPNKSFPSLQGIEKEIVYDLLNRCLFEKDNRFNSEFKGNFIIFLSYIISSLMKKRFIKKNLTEDQLQLGKKEIDLVVNQVFNDLLSYKKLKLEDFVSIDKNKLEKFNSTFLKLHEELISDKIYALTFKKYLYWLSSQVFQIISNKSKLFNLTKFEQQMVQSWRIMDNRININKENPNQSLHVDIREKNVNLISNKTEMYQVERIQRPYSPTIAKIGMLSNKLKERVVFIGRQLFFLVEGNKDGKYVDLAQRYPDLAQEIYIYMANHLKPKLSPKLLRELERKLFHDHTINVSKELKYKLRKFESNTHLYHFLKFEKVYTDLSTFYSQLPLQVLKYVSEMWKAYREGIKEWFKDPSKFRGKPNIPHYNKKTGMFMFGISGKHITSMKYAKGIVENYYNSKRTNIVKNKKGKNIKSYPTAELRLPPKFMKAFEITKEPFSPIRTTIDIEKIVEVRFLPKVFYYVIEIRYTKDIEINPKLDPNRALSIDIGVNILTALTTNFGTPPMLISGKKVKSINQWMNKKIAKLRKIQTQGITMQKGKYIPETIEMKRIRRKRNNIVENYFHKVSRYIVNFSQFHQIQNMAIGYNSGWKQNAKFGNKNTQNFNFIPYHKLIKMIEYKAQLVGIKVKRVREDHTSKCSALDFESIEHHNTYLGKRGVPIKGKNEEKNILKGEPQYKWYQARGLFRSAKGYIIHSDVNGSFNIGRVAFPDLFNKNNLLISHMRLNPISVKV